MGIFGNIAFCGLGKPTIKLEFEDNASLLDFRKKMQEADESTQNANFVDTEAEDITSRKELNGAGDLYLVRDLRTRARKEPGDVGANKNLIFEKQDDNTIKNFNKDFYLLIQQNKDSLGNYPETILFKNKIYGKKDLGYDTGDFGQIFFDVFFPQIKPAKDILKGYTEHEEVNVPIKECINLIPRSKYYFIAYISQDFLKKIFVDFIKNNYNKLLKRRERYLAGGYNTNEIDKEIKYYSLYYSNPQAFSALYMNDRGKVGRAAYEAKKYIDGENFSLGKTANPLLYNNLDILESRGMKPTYKILDNYESFFETAKNKSDFSGFGLEDTKKLIRETCLKHYPECNRIAAHLKADSMLQSAYNLWHWLHHNIRYEYDREGREEIRTPLRTWKDRQRGVDCDCLSVFSWCVLKCMGYEPAFELAAFRNKEQFSHIYINLDGILIDRVWFIFNSLPPHVTKRELFFIKPKQNLGSLF